MGLIPCVRGKSQELQGFEGFPRLSSGDNPSPGAVCEGTTRWGHILAAGLVPAPAFTAILGVEGKLWLQGRNILVWESPERAKKDSFHSFLQDSPSAAGPWWDLGAVSAATAESCGCDLFQEAAGKGSGQ